MKTYLDCYPCFLTQALKSAKLAGANKEVQKRVIDRVARILPNIPLRSSPPETSLIIRNIVRKLAGGHDPYKGIKQKSNELALSIYDLLKKKVARSSDRLLAAVELAIAGNIIDYGAKHSLDINDEIVKILKDERKSIKNENKAIFNYADFKKELKKAKTILYIADNAGETVFDRILIEEIKLQYKNKEIIYAVKEKPVINDATIEDAVACGIEKYANIITSGAETAGAVLKFCSRRFLDVFKNSDMVISKGQGNFEALSGSKRRVFFLLMAKCPVVAEHISSLGAGCKVGDIILYHRRGNAQDKP
ncbi:MAG: DUF89 family protein [Endomicrobiales bacterium]|nr:DUF89 family protein [Endomicrobiales bacterium]